MAVTRVMTSAAREAGISIIARVLCGNLGRFHWRWEPERLNQPDCCFRGPTSISKTYTPLMEACPPSSPPCPQCARSKAVASSDASGTRRKEHQRAHLDAFARWRAAGQWVLEGGVE